MKVDRSLVGVIGIAIVLSTLITLFIIGESAEEDVTILRNEYPSTLSTMEQKYAFVLSMISRRPLEQVKVRYNTLKKIRDEDIAYLDSNVTTGDTHEETIMNLAKINRMMDQARYIGADPDMWNGTVEWRNQSRTYEFDMYMYDFTDVLKASAPGKAGLGATSTYVVWLNQTNGSVFYYFEGVSDYFFNRNRTIVDLTLTHNNQSQRYRAVSEIEVEGKYEQIMEAPMYGTVKFEEVEKDDRLFVIFSLKGTTIPAHNGMLELIRVYKNGKMESFMKNYMKPKT